MEMKREEVRNDFPPIYDDQSRILILGSLPSTASRAAGFYYMNPRNRFWEVLSRLLGEDLTSLFKEGKTAVLLRRHVALSDVVLSCEIYKSSDASLKVKEYTDVDAILRASEVRRIFLNGGTAYDLFLRRYPALAPIAIRLPSTSPANARDTVDSLVAAWEKAISPYLDPRL